MSIIKIFLLSGIASFILFFLGLVGIYNRGIQLRNFIEEAFSTMDVYLKKRWDLIPNLVEIVKGYVSHEKATLEKVTAMRNLHYNQLSTEQKIQVNDSLTQGLSKLIAVAENYPDLKSNENFQQLTQELTDIENDIANSRKYYNGSVREFNTYIESFPICLVASILHFEKRRMFEIEEKERNNVKVQF